MKPAIETIEFHGIPAIRMIGPNGSGAVVSLLGGQLLSWTTPDKRERLFLSDQAIFDGSKAIRGGVPICFPQFSDLGDLPKHGFVRTMPWTVSTERAGEDYALLSLEVSDTEETRAIWPHAFRAEITIMLEADRVDMEFSVENTGGEAFSFTGGLHSYLRVVQVEDVALEGLYGYEYRDAAHGDALKRDSGTEVIVEAEIDRVYHDVSRHQLLKAGNHTLGIQSRGFPDVVVWNPWVDRCAELSDMPGNGWRHMLCVEAAIVQHPVLLPAGEEWFGRQTLVAI